MAPVKPFKYLQYDGDNVLTQPPTNSLLDSPCFGAVTLSNYRRIWGFFHPRPPFMRLLHERTDSFKKGAHNVGLYLYIFEISANQWLQFEGQARKALFHAEPKDMPQFLRQGQKLYDLPPRDKNTLYAMRIIRARLEQDDRFAWLKLKDASTIGSITHTWYEEFWKHFLIEQSKFVSDHAQDIKAAGRARVDQFLNFDWARSSVGEIVVATSGHRYVLANIKSSLIPKPWKRPLMSQLNICIITQYKSGDLVRRFVRNDKNEVVRDKHGIRKVIDRSPITHSRTITYKLLDQIKVPGDNKAGLLEKLKHALQIDLDIDFDEDELEVAWKNPRDFWGNTDVMCRIRTSAEMSKILECLRATHLLKDYNEDTLFLYLCPRSAVQKEGEHPPWPPAYEVEVEIDVRGSAKRKIAAGEHALVSPRRKMMKR